MVSASPALGRFDKNAKVLLDPVLPHEILETERPETAVELHIVVILFRGYDSFCHAAYPVPCKSGGQWTSVHLPGSRT
jgi:hypothetical protein